VGVGARRQMHFRKQKKNYTMGYTLQTSN